MIPLSEPTLTELDQQYLQECIVGGWISSASPWVSRFERAMAEFTGSPFAIAVSSGTAALHLALLAAGVRQGDLVLMPTLTFVATANAISYCRATPWLVDVEARFWQMDLDLVKKNLPTLLYRKNDEWLEKTTHRRVSAILLVHALGYAAQLENWQALAQEYDLPLIEDAAEGLGSSYLGKALGTWGQLGCLSFNGNKIITTGGGGLVLTADARLARQVRHLSTQARTEAFTYHHDEIGYNYRMNGMSAALGLSQLEQLPHFRQQKHEIMERYQRDLGQGFVFPEIHPHCEPNHWLCTARTANRDALAQRLRKKEIQSRALWTPMHQLPMYQDCPYLTEGNHSDELFRTALSLPSSPNLSDFQQDKVIKALLEA